MATTQDLDWAEDKIAHLVYLLANPGLDLFATTQDILDQIEYHKLDCHQVVFGQSIFQVAIAEDNLMVVQRIWSQQPPLPLLPLGQACDLGQPEVFATVKSVVNQAFRWTALTVLAWLIKLLGKAVNFAEIINQVLEDNLVELRNNILSFHLVVSNVKLSNHVQHLITKLSHNAEMWDTPSQILSSLVLLQGYHFADIEQSSQDRSPDHDPSKYQFTDPDLTDSVDLDSTQPIIEIYFEQANATQSPPLSQWD